MLTRQHYKAIAEIINEWKPENRDAEQVRWHIGQQLADYFASDNSRFDRDRFIKACGIE